MTGFAEYAGFGTDPAGDAARREAMASATVAALGDEPGGPEPYPAPVPDHALTYLPGKAGTEVTCQCGRWDGWFNGARSRRRVLDDHAAHVAKELAAVAPIKVRAERTDLPRELPP